MSLSQRAGPEVTTFDPDQWMPHFCQRLLLIKHITIIIHWSDTSVSRAHFYELIIAWKQSISGLDGSWLITAPMSRSLPVCAQQSIGTNTNQQLVYQLKPLVEIDTSIWS